MRSSTVFANIDRLGHEPPSTAAAAVVEKMSRLLLLFLCVSPVALFPVALAVRAYGHFFP
jgi:hypothetical protein